MMTFYSHEFINTFSAIVKFEKYKLMAEFPYNDKNGIKLMEVILKYEPELFPFIIDLVVVDEKVIDILFNSCHPLHEESYLTVLRKCTNNSKLISYFSKKLILFPGEIYNVALILKRMIMKDKTLNKNLS